MRAMLLMPLAALMLASCGEKERKAPDPLADDPALTDALADQIMVDPDLVGQNRASAAVTATGPGSGAVPPERSGAEAAGLARAAAAKLAGGTIRLAPEPAAGGAGGLLRDAATAAQVARAARAGNADCAARVQYSAQWAARLPESLDVYPHGAVQEAAGTDADGCSLRVVHFVTPVGPREVMDYYFTRVTAAGYDARHSLDGGDYVLGGRKGAAAYLVHAKAGEAGLTEVDLVVSGG